MHTTGIRLVTLTLTAAAAMTTMLAAGTAEAKRPRPQPCRPGRYVIEGTPLTVGQTAMTVEAVRVRDDTVSLGSDCEATLDRYVGLRKRRRGRQSAATLLRARLDGCATSGEPMRVRARIDGLCDTMKGVIRAGGKTTRFTARRPATIEDCVAPDGIDETAARTIDRIDSAWEDGGPGSAIATAFLETARRYTLGARPETPLERDLHKRFGAMGPEGQQLIACAARNYTTLRNLGDTNLLSTEVVATDEEPVSHAALARALNHELLSIADAQFGPVSQCAGGERAGAPRAEIIVDPDGGIGNVHYAPRICELRGIRTADFLPPLTTPELDERVLEAECTITANQRADCPVLVVDSPEECPGSPRPYGPASDVRWLCYRVPWVQQGETVSLRGLNFRDTGIQVELRNKTFPGTRRTIDSFVCGDTVTPATEIVDGGERAILDCRRVEERLSFVVPDDLPPGIYEVRVIVPESNPLLGRESSPAYLRVLLPADATYELNADLLECVDPTNWEPGSDEVSLKFVAVPIGLDSTAGPAQASAFSRGSVDKGDLVAVATKIISVSARDLGGVAVAMVGHEVDDRDVYEKGITDFADAYVEFTTSSWNAIAQDIGRLTEGAAQALGAGSWSSVIGDLFEKSVHAWWAFWAPADLIIADHVGLSQVEITELVSISHPAPPSTEYRGAEGIRIVVEPGEKLPSSYEESRVYSGNSASSTYRLFLRHNRT